MRRAPGLSLAETVLSMFVLAAAMLVLVNLFHASLRYQGKVEKSALAAQLAQNRMDRLRAWCEGQTGGRYNFNLGWSGVNGVDATDPDYPGYTVRVDAVPSGRLVYSPCTNLEQIYGARARRMNSSLIPVRVTVSWQPPDPLNRVTLFSYVGEPVHDVQPLIVTQIAGPSSPIPQDGVVTLSVAAQDANGDPLPDLMVDWYAEPGGTTPALGTLLDTGPRDGSTVDFQHRYLKPDGVTWAHKQGTCKVVARATYFGQPVSGEITLDLDAGPLP